MLIETAQLNLLVRKSFQLFCQAMCRRDARFAGELDDPEQAKKLELAYAYGYLQGMEDARDIQDELDRLEDGAAPPSPLAIVIDQSTKGLIH